MTDSKRNGAGKAADSQRSTPRVPPLMWGFTIVFALASGLGGYVIGERDGQNNAMQKIAAGELPGSATDNAGQGRESTAPVTEIPDDVAPGTDFTPAKATADGVFDATIQGPGSPITSREEIANSARRDPADPMAHGALDAPVVIAEFTDWDCPYCIRHAAQTEPDLIKEYVDTGYVRIEWNDMPINGPAAHAAARAGRAAAEQGKFVEYKKAYFEAAAAKGGHPGFGIDEFLRFAEEAGVPDLDKFKADAESDKYDATLSKALEYAQGLGIDGTPGFIVGNEFIGGALPIDDFRRVINGELAASAKK